MENSPDTIDDSEYQLVLRPPHHYVERRSIAWWTVSALSWVIPPVAGLILLAVLIEPARFWLLLPAYLIGIPGLLYIAIMPWWRYRVHRWETTKDAVYTRSGWIRQHWRIAPLSRIQTVDTVRGPLQQLFGLSSITITTASAAGPVRIDGLDSDRARTLADDLAIVTQSTTGDAT